MREIKFRAWYTVEKNMYEVRCLHFHLGIVAVNFPRGEENLLLPTMAYLHNVELMQYTGHKDKNGTEIYEDDIVRFIKITHTGRRVEVIGHIVWNEMDSGFSILKRSIEYPVLGEMEVIGNIYENPKLLRNT